MHREEKEQILQRHLGCHENGGLSLVKDAIGFYLTMLSRSREFSANGTKVEAKRLGSRLLQSSRQDP